MIENSSFESGHSIRKLAVSCNMDSFGHSIGQSPLPGDPFWHQVLDRILNIADKHCVPITFFVIGSDLQDVGIAKRVKELNQLGHEIANHSFSHPQNFGLLDSATIRNEIALAHNLIAQCTGMEPVSFLSPGWNVNPYQGSILKSLGYSSDSSYFPHFILQLALIKMIQKKVIDRLQGRKTIQYSYREILSRQDYLLPLLGVEKWLKLKGLQKEVPLLPMENGNKIFPPPYWFTLEYFSKHLAQSSFRNFCKTGQKYLVIHPADFSDISDVKSIRSYKTNSLGRMDIGYKKYLKLFEERLLNLKLHGAQFTRMRDLND